MSSDVSAEVHLECFSTMRMSRGLVYGYGHDTAEKDGRELLTAEESRTSKGIELKQTEL